MFKRLMYDKVAEVWNMNTQTVPVAGGKEAPLKVEKGYLLGLYPSGIPYAVKQLDPTTKYSFAQVEVVPLSEELSQETPSINKSDRSDYTFRYQVMFRSDIATQVEDALVEFRDYFFTNKQFTLDGYTVAVKTTRGDKLPQVGMNDGQFYNYYAFTVYATAIKNGYIKKDTDTWGMQLDSVYGDTVLATALVVGDTYKISGLGNTDWNTVFGTTSVVYVIGDSGICEVIGTGTGTTTIDYQELVLTTETFTSQGNPIFSNASGIGKGHNTHSTSNNRLNLIYSGTTFDKVLYSRIMNTLDKDTSFKLTHTFDGVTFPFTAQITTASRSLLENGVVIMVIDWMVEDE